MGVRRQMLETIDILLRGACIGVLALQAALALRRPVSFRALTIAAFCVGVVAYVLASSPWFAARLGPLGHGAGLVAVINPFLLWWAGLALFDDGFRPRLWHALPLVLVAAFTFTFPPLRAALVAALYLHLLYVAIATSRGDLVERRRRFRRWFIALAAIFGLIVAATEATWGAAPLPAPVYPLHAATLLALALAFAIWSLTLAPDLRPAPPAPVSVLSPADRALLARLTGRMEAGIWREEGLTIGRLSAALDAPEHRLRRVINGALGHRNFAAFINARRIEAAQAALADPVQAETPILNIAYDAGFASLGPFNRAFRDLTGESPSEYRRRSLADLEKS